MEGFGAARRVPKPSAGGWGWGGYVGVMGYTPQQLADIRAIEDAAKRYSHGVDRLDGDWMKSAYWPDATDDHGTFVGNAWEFVDHCMASHGRWRSTMHCVYNHQIELDADASATAMSGPSQRELRKRGRLARRPPFERCARRRALK